MTATISRLDSGVISLSDWFCGAGGSSTGAVNAGLEVWAAANHWQRAIDTHTANHPNTQHYLTNLSQALPHLFPSTTGLWASPECPWHSNASGRSKKNKGQQRQRELFEQKGQAPDPAGERSRATMYCVHRFTEEHEYEFMIVENVVEASKWVLFDHWLKGLEILGYETEIVCINAMFFHQMNGQSSFAPQSRDRMYVAAWKKGNRRPNFDFRPWAWCPNCQKNVQAKQVWKNPRKRRIGKYGSRGQYIYACSDCLIKWNAVQAKKTKKGKQVEGQFEMFDVREDMSQAGYERIIKNGEVVPYYYSAFNIIDWTIEAPKIGDRKKPLVENTMNRIQYGLDEFGSQPLYIPIDYGQNQSTYGKPIMVRPLPTMTTENRIGLAVPNAPYIVDMYGTGTASSIEDAVGTITTGRSHHWLTVPNAPFITKLMGESNALPIDDPLHTIMASGNQQYLTIPNSPVLISYYNRDNAASPVEGPMPVVTTEPRFGLVTPPFLASYQHNREDGVSRIDGPLPSLTTRNNYGLVVPNSPFLTEYNRTGEAIPVDGHLSTLTTKDRHNLVIPESNLDIMECGFRMLVPHENMLGQGFPFNYIITGQTQEEQQKQIGNAVYPGHAEFLTGAQRDALS